MVAISSNHLEIITIHEANRECILLRSVIQHIQESCRLPSIKDNPTTLFEDNVTCIAQVKGGYIKRDRTKHISPKLRSFIHMNSKRVVKLMFNKYAQVII